MSRWRLRRGGLTIISVILPRLGQFLILVAALGLLVRGGERATGQPGSTIGLLAIDTITIGNTETSLGALDGCTSFEPGEAFDIDYVVDAIPQDRPMIGFDVEIRYDPRILEAVRVDTRLLLASVGTYSPQSALSDPLPDTDGNLRISVVDTASSSNPQANVESGPGVLARVTFRAKAAGVSKLSIGFEKEPLLYPLVLDTQDQMILVDKLGSASISVGRDCSAEAIEPEITDLGPINQEIISSHPEQGTATGTPAQGGSGGPPGSGSSASPAGRTPSGSPTSSASGSSSSANGSGGGSSVWPIVLVAALAALAVGGGAAWYLYRRSRSSPGPG